MNTLVFFLMILAMILTVVALFGGLIVMAIGGETNRKYGNKFMQARVWMQGIALAFFALAVFLHQGS
ncbi:MAG: twin transmembrane helix small protein [Pseudobdellovibrionaceae bacterium]